MFRWIVIAVFASNIGISAYYRRKARQSGETISRAEEGMLFILLRLVFAIRFLISSEERSSLWVEIAQEWPNGSETEPDRSP